MMETKLKSSLVRRVLLSLFIVALTGCAGSGETPLSVSGNGTTILAGGSPAAPTLTVASATSGDSFTVSGVTFTVAGGPTARNVVPLAANDNTQAVYIANAFNSYAQQKGIGVTAIAENGVVTFKPTSGGAPVGPCAVIPTGTVPITLTAATPAATFAALAPVVKIGCVAISSPPRVMFSVADSADNPIIGLGSTSKSATATVANYPNLSFSLAKLVPGANGSPSKWVSYIVTTVPTTTLAMTATRPSSDNTGTLVDNKDGTYAYTFYRDITKVKDVVAGLTLTGLNVAADLGDLTYDPTLTHRLTIQLAGVAPGTGTNTPDAVQVAVGVPLARPVNAVYDFIPATGKAVTAANIQRNIVDLANCNECHGKLGGVPGTASASVHGGNRYEPQYCVVCHTDQRKFGQAASISTANAFAPVTPTSPPTYIADGVTVGNFPILAHTIHMGTELVKKNYNYAGVLLNQTRYPQDVRNCTKCHDNTRAAQADNWKKLPSRAACGACHDGINWATGTGTTTAGATTGHIGGAKADDSLCALCHTPVDIPLYHIPVTPPNPSNALLVNGGNLNTNSAWIASNTNSLPAGAIKVSYDIYSVSLNASRQPVMVFRMLQNGARADFNIYGTVGKTEIWDNFMGSPSAYFVWAVPQDGVTAPADFNASASGYIRSIWNGSSGGNGKGSLTGPDANGYYTVTLTGVQIPGSAVMLTGGMGYTYNVTGAPPLTQTNLADYPVSAATATSGLTTGMPNKIGGLIVIAPNAQKLATGYSGRRAIVEDFRCNQCHLELGTFTAEAFHAGQRNDATTCSWCHNPIRTSSGWSADSSSFVHAIHAAYKRTVKFTWHAATTTSSFADVGYPGILSDCETCHLPGTFDFSASASANALPNRLYRTVATGIFTGTIGTSLTSYSPSTSPACTVAVGVGAAQTDIGAFSLSPYILPGTNYGIGFSYNAGLATSNTCRPDGSGLVAVAPGSSVAADATTLVISPITTACFSCHDSDLAASHMKSNGGSIYEARATALAKMEQCTLCHGPDKIADIKTVHAK